MSHTTHVACQQLACAFMCWRISSCLWLLQVLTDQLDATEKDQVGHNQERQRLSAWRDKVTGLEAALGELAGHSEKYPASPPSGSTTSPALKLRYLSRRFHMVCNQNSTCTVLSGSVCRQVSQGLCAGTPVFNPRCGELGVIHLLQALGIELALLVLVMGISCCSAFMLHRLAC